MTTAAEPALTEMLLFRVGGEFFALPLARTEEAVESLARDPLPGMPAGMLGVAEHRGKRIAVYAPAPLFGVSNAERDGVTLLIRADAGRVALLVDDVEDVIEMDPAGCRPVPGPAAPDPVLISVLPCGDKLVAICDADALVRACLGASA